MLRAYRLHGEGVGQEGGLQDAVCSQHQQGDCHEGVVEVEAAVELEADKEAGGEEYEGDGEEDPS